MDPGQVVSLPHIQRQTRSGTYRQFRDSDSFNEDVWTVWGKPEKTKLAGSGSKQDLLALRTTKPPWHALTILLIFTTFMFSWHDHHHKSLGEIAKQSTFVRLWQNEWIGRETPCLKESVENWLMHRIKLMFVFLSVGLYTTLKTDEFIIHKVSVLKPVLKSFTLDDNFVCACKCMSHSESRFPGSGEE